MITLQKFRPDPKPEKREKKKPKPLRQNKPIAKKSKKQNLEDKKYGLRAKVWLEGKTCECCGEEEAQQVHHAKNRKGYADQWAYDRRITLLHDERFWKALCAVCHDQVERNPEWATEMGYTLTRTDIIVK